ncbi:MAG: hypothetical protein RR824_00715 [Clostridia bacterium]
MFRKISITLLSLALALLLPLQAFAATQFTFSVLPSPDLPESLAAVNDLCKTTSLKVLAEDQSASFSLVLGGEDALSAVLKADQDGFFIQSAVLSDDVLYFTWDDLFQFLLKTAVSTASANGSPMDEKAVAALNDGFQTYKQELISAFEQVGATASAPADSLAAESSTTLAQIKEEYQQLSKDDPELFAVLQDMLKRSTFTQGEFTSSAHDPATIQAVVPFNADDLMKLLDVKSVQSALVTAIAADGSEMSVEDAIAKAKEFCRTSEFTSTTTVLYNANNQIISLEMPSTGKVSLDTTDESGKTTTQWKNIGMNLVYNQLSKAQDVNHKAELTLSADGTQLMTFVFDHSQFADNTSHGILGVLVGQQEMNFVYDGSFADGVKDRNLALYMRQDAASLIAPSEADRPMITFNLKSQEVESTMLDRVNAATVATSKQLATMSAEDQAAFNKQFQSRIMQTLFSLYSKLPASVIELVLPTNNPS